MIKTLSGLRRELGTRKALLFLKRRHQSRINPNGVWGDEIHELYSYWGVDEAEIAEDYNFVVSCGDIDQWCR